MTRLTPLETKVAIAMMLGASLVETAKALGYCRSRIEALKWRGLAKLRQGAKIL